MAVTRILLNEMSGNCVRRRHSAHELKIFLKERFVEIKSLWYSSVKQLVNELPQSDRKNLYYTNKKQKYCTLLALF
jgi:hypothetical protein